MYFKPLAFDYPEDEFATQVLGQGHHYVGIALDEVVFFIRPDKLVPVTKSALSVEALDEENLSLLSFVKTEASYELYQDDGFSKEYEREDHFITITQKQGGETAVRGKRKITIVN